MLEKLDLKKIDWVIIGGESGFNFRKVEKQWILDIIKQCKKQKGGRIFQTVGRNKAKIRRENHKQ